MGDSRYGFSRFHSKSRYIQHDIRKPLPEISEVENVVHLAAIPGFKACDENRSLAWQVNVEGTRNICEFARRMDVEKLIFASTCGCYRNKKYYAVTKLEGRFNFKIRKHLRSRIPI
ncbi:MAG: NAD-dependent epimerase/dehydratase family protein [Candidatus Helarchaeota archaeon]